MWWGCGGVMERSGEIQSSPPSAPLFGSSGVDRRWPDSRTHTHAHIHTHALRQDLDAPFQFATLRRAACNLHVI